MDHFVDHSDSLGASITSISRLPFATQYGAGKGSHLDIGAERVGLCLPLVCHGLCSTEPLSGDVRTAEERVDAFWHDLVVRQRSVLSQQ